MNTVTLHFRAEGQKLIPLDGIYNYASNTVEYIRAVFELGENWTDFDVVRAAWFTDYDCIVTVLDTDGVCVVPAEVLNKRAEVCVNLFGCDVDEDELVNRLTTYPIKAVLIDANARVCGSETAPITPSQFEQFIEIVEGLVGSVKDIERCVLNADYTLTIYYSDGTSDTVGPIRGEQGATGPAGNGISSIAKIGSTGTNPVIDTYRITYTNGTHTDFTVTNGLKGDTGATGNGIESVYLTATHGAVKTYTILFTDGSTYDFNVTDGEVTNAVLEQVLPTDTASGSIASFPDGSDLFDYLSCIVDIDPVQDLHGYDKPWAGGAGKNKLQIEDNTSTINLVTFTQTADGSIIVNGTASADTIYQVKPKQIQSGVAEYGLLSDIFDIQADTSYILSGCPSGGSVNTYRLQFLVYGSGIEPYDTGNGSNQFSWTASDISTKQYRLCIRISSGTVCNNLVFKPMVRLASVADSTFAPYANICPITGWTGCEVVKTGFNVWDEETESGGISNTGEPFDYPSKIRTKNYVPIVPNTTYFISMPNNAIGNGIMFYDSAKTFISYVWKGTSSTFTTPENARYLKFDFSTAYGTTYNNDISINYPSTDTEYHAYNGTTYPITWQDEAGTVYGGTVDIVSGVLTVDRAKVTLDNTLTYAWYGNYQQASISDILQNSPAKYDADVPNLICDKLNAVANSGRYTNIGNYCTLISSGNGIAVSTPGTSAEEFATWIANNPVAVVYKLATPQTYQLTPVQVACLLGRNNVFANCGNIEEVQYKADVQRYIEKMLNA